MLDLAGKRILITGASAGLGHEFARQFHALGATVLLVARREERLKTLCQELNAQRPDSAEFVQVDLAKSEELARLEEIVRAKHFDVLLNNAGRGSFGYFDEQDMAAEEEMLNLNVLSYMRLTHAVIPQMKARRAGTIINISSVTGFQPLPFMSTYAATKAFNLFHGLALRRELAPHGIRVMLVCPGPTATEFGEAARVPDAIRAGWKSSAEFVVQKTLTGIERNAAIVTPGVINTCLCWLAKVAPFAISTKIMERVLRRGVGV